MLRGWGFFMEAGRGYPVEVCWGWRFHPRSRDDIGERLSTEQKLRWFFDKRRSVHLVNSHFEK
jgi:hypothetical protein